jgi:hypothetical protein
MPRACPHRVRDKLLPRRCMDLHLLESDMEESISAACRFAPYSLIAKAFSDTVCKSQYFPPHSWRIALRGNAYTHLNGRE